MVTVEAVAIVYCRWFCYVQVTDRAVQDWHLSLSNVFILIQKIETWIKSNNECITAASSSSVVLVKSLSLSWVDAVRNNDQNALG